MTGVSKARRDALYGIVLERAMRYAQRHLDDDASKDLAHEISVSFLRRQAEGGEIPAAENELNKLIYRAVINRLIDLQRTGHRRAIAEDVHAKDLLEKSHEWNNPGAIVEATELAGVVRETIAAMPPRMQRIFLLVRDHDHSYQEVASALGVGVGTVHTQISRAYGLLRDAVDRYRSAGSGRPGAQSATANAPANRRANP